MKLIIIFLLFSSVVSVNSQSSINEAVKQFGEGVKKISRSVTEKLRTLVNYIHEKELRLHNEASTLSHLQENFADVDMKLQRKIQNSKPKTSCQIEDPPKSEKAA